ncbi:hypothetical protein LE190_10705 [Massilia oculi]|uniref:Uncharacterized protein n=1 Tax=Massilia hydrophila TaxID=3044279 RepID=A0ABS7YDQ9_9BURK|nr:hypothetical protein [Massilia oculi]MCA1856389.1 hypothetical protein [Massilia oculi]
MRRFVGRPAVLMLGALLLCGASGASTVSTATAATAPAAADAAAAAGAKPTRELEPVHVNAMRNPEVRKYKVILAGLDAFDRHHGLAPASERLRFRLVARKKDEAAEPLAARLVGDGGFRLPVAIDAGLRFTVPRSEAAEDADSELELNRKRRVYRTEPEVRTPGLAEGRRRLGDLRLECKVTIAMAKAEIPTFWVLTINTLLLRTDWCGFFGDPDDFRWESASRTAHFPFFAERPLREAVLVDGNRSARLEVNGETFHVPVGNVGWSDDAVIELKYADQADTGSVAGAAGPRTDATGTAGETPRTAP